MTAKVCVCVCEEMGCGRRWKFEIVCVEYIELNQCKDYTNSNHIVTCWWEGAVLDWAADRRSDLMCWVVNSWMLMASGTFGWVFSSSIHAVLHTSLVTIPVHVVLVLVDICHYSSLATGHSHVCIENREWPGNEATIIPFPNIFFF